MKNPLLILVGLLCPAILLAQGDNCANAIPLISDGVCRTYSFSTATEPSVSSCHYTGSGRVIYFKLPFTNGDPVPCVAIETSLSGPANLEGAVMSGTSTCNNSGMYYQTVCFEDGTGFWAPNDGNVYGEMDFFFINDYYVRFRAEAGFNGQITICAKENTPTNLHCQQASSLSNIPTWFNNACHIGDTIPSGDVCASTLENTAWYKYTLTGTGEDILNVSAINCDNYIPENYGFQVGIFTGVCGNLQSYGPCFTGGGGSLQFPLTGLPQGTTIFIAMDGKASSNCRYLMWTGTAPHLPGKWGYLSGQAVQDGNLLRWSTLDEVNSSYIGIERSIDGRNFGLIGTVQAAGNASRTTQYNYKDLTPPIVSYYRLKLTDADGRFIYSKTILIERQNIRPLQLLMQNPVGDVLTLMIDSRMRATGDLIVINSAGQLMSREKIAIVPGQQTFIRPVQRLGKGVHYLIADFGNTKEKLSFIKQ